MESINGYGFILLIVIYGLFCWWLGGRKNRDIQSFKDEIDFSAIVKDEIKGLAPDWFHAKDGPLFFAGDKTYCLYDSIWLQIELGKANACFRWNGNTVVKKHFPGDFYQHNGIDMKLHGFSGAIEFTV